MSVIQSCVYQFEGSMNKFLVDDKGVILLAVFGLPPLPHRDDSLRAVLASLHILKDIQKLGLQCAMGITVGRVFCGVVGSPIRKEYTVMGDVVNLAARCMQRATQLLHDQNTVPRSAYNPSVGRGLRSGVILCDEDVFFQTSLQIEYMTLTGFKLKGKAKLAIMHSAYGIKDDHLEAPVLQQIFGRTQEKEFLENRLERAIASQGGSLVITGGMGVSFCCFCCC